MHGHCVANKEVRNWVDIPSDRARATFRRLGNRRPTTHEWIENGRIPNTDRLIEQVEDVCTARCKRADYDRAENGPEPLRPPLMNMRKWPVNFLSPAFN